jgi:hypothetical protein
VYASAREAAGGTLDEKAERAFEFPVVAQGTMDDFDKLAARKLAGLRGLHVRPGRNAR